MLQQFIHYGIHFLGPVIIALIFFKNYWKQAAFFMLLGNLIDLDHLFADPIFDPNRCSINFHPLHSYYAVAVYAILLFPKSSRIIAIGLLLHIVADSLDCFLSQL